MKKAVFLLPTLLISLAFSSLPKINHEGVLLAETPGEGIRELPFRKFHPDNYRDGKVSSILVPEGRYVCSTSPSLPSPFRRNGMFCQPFQNTVPTERETNPDGHSTNMPSLRDEAAISEILPFQGEKKSETVPGFRLKTVVIDAGHGGHDPGCSGSKSKEKHLCLAIAKYVAQALEQNYPDIKVILTRSTDVFITLNERAAIATRNKADLFISIHCNFIPKASHIHGSETYVLGLHATNENLEVAKRENASILLEENYQETYGYDPNSPEAHIVMSMFQNAFLEQSISFAQKVQEHANGEAGRRNKGVKQAGFLVLRHATMPSVLVETGYLSNLTEEQFLRSKNGQKRMANAILLAFHDYKTEIESGGGDLASLKKLPLDEAEEIHEPTIEVAEQKPAGQQANLVTASEKIESKNTLVKPGSSKQQQPGEQRPPNNEQPTVVQVKQETPPKPEREQPVQKEEKQEVPPAKNERLETHPDSYRDDLLASVEPVLKNDPPRSSGKILPSVEVETSPAPVSQKPAQNVDVQYRVQLAASPRLLDVSKGAWLKVEYLLEVVEEDKLYKYQVRTFATLEEANSARNKLRSIGFNDAFVVGYQNGKRVK